MSAWSDMPDRMLRVLAERRLIDQALEARRQTNTLGLAAVHAIERLAQAAQAFYDLSGDDLTPEALALHQRGLSDLGRLVRDRLPAIALAIEVASRKVRAAQGDPLAGHSGVEVDRALAAFVADAKRYPEARITPAQRVRGLMAPHEHPHGREAAGADECPNCQSREVEVDPGERRSDIGAANPPTLSCHECGHVAAWDGGWSVVLTQGRDPLDTPETFCEATGPMPGGAR